MYAVECVSVLRDIPTEIIKAIASNFSLGVRKRESGRYEARVNDNGLKSLGMFYDVDDAIATALLYRVDRLIAAMNKSDKHLTDAALSHEKYLIFLDGDIFNLKGEKLTPKTNNKGYWQVMLTHNGKEKLYLVHRIVAESFIPNPNNFPQVNHKDGDKNNNHVNNLEWCTKSMNELHAFQTGLKRTGGSSAPVYTNDEKDYIKSHLGETGTNVAKHLGRSETGVRGYMRKYRREFWMQVVE
nr:MAG TPA: homing endonuclease [Caudoviricetes sp.]